MRQAADDERREDFVCARHRREGMHSVIRVQHDSNPEEQRKLRQDDHAAEYEREPAVAQVPARQQALDEQLVGTMRCHRQERAADEAGPERERQARIPRPRHDLQLAGARRVRDDRRPAARDEVNKHVAGQERSADVDHELHEVGPDHGGDPAFERVDEGEHTDEHDRPEP